MSGEIIQSPTSSAIDASRRTGTELILAGRVIALVTGTFVAILAFRFALLLLDANLYAGFTRLIYALSAPLIAPFRNVFRVLQSDTGNVLEWSALLALSVYALVGGAISRMVIALGRRQLLMAYSPHAQEPRPPEPSEELPSG